MKCLPHSPESLSELDCRERLRRLRWDMVNLLAGGSSRPLDTPGEQRALSGFERG